MKADDSTSETSSTKTKRKRSPNFTDEERRLLLKLSLEETDVLESKASDSESWKMKEMTWLKIANAFNASSYRSTYRSAEGLHQKYATIKNDLKKKLINCRNGVKNIKIDVYEKQLLKIISNNSSDDKMDLPENIEDHIKIEDVDFESDSNQRSMSMPEEYMLTATGSSNVPNQHIHRQNDEEDRRKNELHSLKMENLQIEKHTLLNTEERLRVEHAKKLELLELQLESQRYEILLKKKKLDL